MQPESNNVNSVPFVFAEVKLETVKSSLRERCLLSDRIVDFESSLSSRILCFSRLDRNRSHEFAGNLDLSVGRPIVLLAESNHFLLTRPVCSEPSQTRSNLTRWSLPMDRQSLAKGLQQNEIPDPEK